MAQARIATTTGTALLTRIQAECGDPDVTRFSATEYLQALNDALVELGNIMAIAHTGEALLSTTLSYSGSTPNALPSGVNAEGIVRVDDSTESTRSVALKYLSPQEFEDYDSTGITYGTARGYTLMGETSAGSYRIWVLPRPGTTRTLTIYYIATPWILGAVGDNHPLSPRWQELLVLKAALKLLRRDAEATETQLIDEARLMGQFVALSNRQRDRSRVPQRRRFG